jgi:putative phosphoesterase
MLIAIVSDTHMPKGDRRIPDACLERIRAADLLLHCGDVSTSAVLDELAAIGPPLMAVHGNVESDEVHKQLPEQRIVDAGGARIGMVHDGGPARGRLRRLKRRFENVDAVVFGHSHIPLHEEEGSFQIFNPGSPTERRRAPHHTMGIARVKDGRVEFELVEVD